MKDTQKLIINSSLLITISTPTIFLQNSFFIKFMFSRLEIASGALISLKKNRLISAATDQAHLIVECEVSVNINKNNRARSEIYL